MSPRASAGEVPLLSKRTLARALARGVKLARIISRPAYRRALRRGVAAAAEHERIDLPDDIRTVLDVGANRGQFAVVAAERWPGAQLICFEPLPDARRRLSRVLADVPNVQIRSVALSDEPGDAELHIARADDSSSLLPITSRQVATFPGTDQVGVLEVRTARLDVELNGTGLTRPVLLKIDVQGGELQVLHGAVGMLDRVDVILVECSFIELYAGQPLAHDLVAFLAAQGLVLTGVGLPTMDGQGRVVQLDLVFGRPGS